MNKTLVVLAAGMGSRFGGLKQLDPLGPSGETIIEYSLFDALRTGFDHVVFIVRESFYEDFRAQIGIKAEANFSVSYVMQKLDTLPSGFIVPSGRDKPWGTGHALYCAMDYIKSPFLIINGDDFYGCDAFAKAAEAMNRYSGQSEFGGLVSYSLGNTLSDKGAVSRGICAVGDDDRLESVRETHDIARNPESGKIESDSGVLDPLSLASMNLWYFSPTIFPEVSRYIRAFLERRGGEAKSEFYLPTIANRLIEEEKMGLEVLTTDARWYGVTYKKDRETVKSALAGMVREGVYPKNLKESFDVRI